MKSKFSLILFLCICSLAGLAQNATFQELVNKKQFDVVIARADSLTPADSADYAIMSAVAQAYEGMLRFKDAYTCYKHCLSMDTTNVDALNALARASQNYGKVGEAKRCYLKVLETDTLNFYANLQLARLYYQLGEYGESMEYYNTLNEIEYNNPILITGLADCHMKRNTGPNTLIAVSLYMEALKLNPENTRIASSLINTLMAINDPKGALAVCDTALFYNSENRSVRQSQGMALYMVRDFVRADSAYSCLLAEGDSSFLTCKYTGASRYMAGQPMDAIEPLQLAYEMDTTDVETTLLLGGALGKTYDRKRAYELYDQAEKNMQPKPFLLDMLFTFRTETYKRDGRFLEAYAMYYDAWKKNPKRLDLLGKISMHYGNSIQEYANEEERQRGLFIKNLYIKELLKKGEPIKYGFVYRPFLISMYEDAFFRNVDALPMLAPDGRKSKLPVTELHALIDQLPEMTEKERQAQKKAMEYMKRQQEEKKKKEAEEKRLWQQNADRR